MKISLALLEVFPYYEMREEEPEHGYEFTDEEIEFILDAQERMRQAQVIMKSRVKEKPMVRQDPGGSYVSETWKSFFKRD